MAGEIKKPVVREINGLCYLLGKEKVLFENGVCIDREEFEAIKDESLEERIEYAKKNEIGFDWKHACETGYLRKERRRFLGKTVFDTEEENDFAEAEQNATPLPIELSEETNENISEKEVLKNNRFFDSFSSMSLLFPVMTFVGIGSAIMSAYHTTVFLWTGGKPFWAAFLTGVMLVCFSGTAFTAARYFYAEEGANKVFGIMFYVAGSFVIAYSIFSTITVNYDQFAAADNKKDAIAIEVSNEAESAKVIIARNEEALKTIDKDIEYYRAQVEYWQNKSWARRDDAQKSLDDAIERRKVLENAVIEKSESVVESVKKRETVYQFLSRLTGLSEDVARFFVYVIPACLYDVLAPFALSVVLLLIDKRKKEAK